MAGGAAGRIRVGVGGWTYEPWRGSFYPAGLAHKRELEFASRRLTAIEVNGTFYRSPGAAAFARWRDETPDEFVFALKAPRFATTRRELKSAGESIERFVASGIAELRHKLGPINWQLPPTKELDLEDVAAFLALLPKSVEGLTLRHALEVRHASFRSPGLVALTRGQGVAIVLAGDAEHPQITDRTAPFVYARLMGTVESEPLGYAEAALDRWAARARAWAAGRAPDDLAPPLAATGYQPAGEVFLFVIGGHKVRNPAAAMALIERLR